MSWQTHHPVLKWYTQPIAEACATHGLDPSLVAALILTESSGKPSAYRFEPMFYRRYQLAKHPVYGAFPAGRVSSSYGLMQILYTTAYELGMRREPEELFVPSVNLQWGCLYFKRCLEWAGKFSAPDKDTLISALAAYNGGKNSAQAPPNPKNAPYALRVLAHLQSLQ